MPIYYGGNYFRETLYDPHLYSSIKWLTPEKRMMVSHLQIHNSMHDLFWSPYSSPTSGCLSCARGAKQGLETLLKRENIQISEGAIEVFVQLQKGAEGGWTNSPEGECQLAECCGNEPQLAGL